MRRLGLTLAFCLAAVAAWAHSGATGVVKQRMDGMKAMSDATKALGAIAAGAIPYKPLTIRRAAGMLSEHTAAAKDQFPEGTGGGVSEALPLVWAEKDRFNALLDELLSAAARLEAAAEDKAAAMAAAEAVAATCKNCHADFRKKKLF